MNNLQDQRDWAPYQFNQYHQWAGFHPSDTNMYRTFFLERDHLAKKIRICGETNWVYGEVPPTIRVAHPMHLDPLNDAKRNPEP